VARAVKRVLLGGACGFAFCLVLVAALAHAATYGKDGPLTNPTDFRTFYCAGRALAVGRDPYRVEPMRGCLRDTLAQNGLRYDERFVFPAPFPPYAIGVFSLFGRLPFKAATVVWLALDLFAFGVIVVTVRQLSGLGPALVALATAGPIGYASLMFGQIVPIVVAGLTVAALSLRRGNRTGLALGAAVGALEPHLAVPVWIGAFVCVRAARVPLVIAGAGLIAISFAFGAPLNVEFAASVLPAHARSELFDFASQYSLSSLLAAIGIPVRVALISGTLSYLIMLGLGVRLGNVLSRRLSDPAFSATAPLAAVLLGGPFLHAHQIAAALPFALMLAKRVRPGSIPFVALVTATIALAVPWETIAQTSFFADRAAARRDLPPVSAAQTAPAPVAGDAPIEPQYTAFIDAYAERIDRRARGEQFLWKLPTWLALMLLLGAGTAAARGRAQPVENGQADFPVRLVRYRVGSAATPQAGSG
jgi:hypothetical protein